MTSRRRVAGLLLTGVTAATLLLALTFVVGVYRIVGDSMSPTLRPGSHVVVERLGVPPGGYALGELVAFRAPVGWETAGEVLVKRVVGRPGDVITIYEGELRRNGSVVEEPYLAPGTTELQGRLIGTWVVAPDQYFLLGDNRLPSLDSRLFGAIDASRIIGRLLLPHGE